MYSFSLSWQVLRPFLLRRLKADVERQLPKKYEHVVLCRLSKRQRFLYEEFMSRRSTKETLSGGNFMSVINILMQLRKVCNHPDMFDPRPIISPYQTDPISLEIASTVSKALEYNPLKVSLNDRAYICFACSSFFAQKHSLRPSISCSILTRTVCIPIWLNWSFVSLRMPLIVLENCKPQKSS